MSKNRGPEITRSCLSSSEPKFGHIIEDKFLIAMGKLGVPEVPNQLKNNDTRDKKTLAIARATPEEDSNGVDFWLYIPPRNTWYPIDLTTACDPYVTNIKKHKELKTGIKILHIDPRTIELASLGAEVYLKRVNQAVIGLFTDG